MRSHKMRHVLSGFAIIVMFVLYLNLAHGEEPQIGQHEYSLELDWTTVNYLLFLPEQYASDPSKEWPLILFLHGAGERGSNLNAVKVHGPPKIAEQQGDFPFIVVSPQCPGNTWWTDPTQLNALIELLDEVIAKCSVDTERIYLTGLSMGGYGTWYLAARHPERFAAIVPICGGGEPWNACALKDVPTWVFHGARDTVVRPEESQKMVEALGACGGDVKFTLYPNAGHDAWTETYNNPEVYDWFLQYPQPATTEVQICRKWTSTWGEIKGR